jgi:hypothetical protein
VDLLWGIWGSVIGRDLIMSLEYCNALLLSAHWLIGYVLFWLLKVKVNQARYRPGVAQKVLRKLRFPDFLITVQDGGKVVSLTHRPPLPPGNTSGSHFC